MYHPFCAFSCVDSIDGVYYLRCSEYGSMTDDGGMSMDMSGDDSSGLITSDDCKMTDSAMLSTIAWCLKLHCQDESSDSLQAVWSSNNVSNIYTYLGSLELGTPSHVIEDDALWLNTTGYVNPTLYRANYDTLSYFSFQETMHARFGFALLMVGWFFCLIGVLHRLTEHLQVLPPSYSAFINRHLLKPALFSSRADAPLPYDVGYLPPRLVSIGIFIFFVLNLLFCCVPYKTVAGSTWYTSSARELYAYVGNRTGILSFANIPLLLLFGVRNNIMAFLTGWSQTTFMHFHRWIAYIATVEAIVHSILYTAAYLDDGGAASYAEQAALAYFQWGIVATVAMGLAVAFSVLWIRKRYYETFLVGHIVLAILTIVGCWYHIKLRYTTEWGYIYWIYAAIAVWAFDMLLRCTRLCLFNFRSTKAIAEVVPGELLRVVVFPSFEQHAAAGRHTFLYWPTISLPWTSHPLTVALSGRYSDIISGTAAKRSKEKTDRIDEISLSENSSSESAKFVECNDVIPELPDVDPESLVYVFYIRPICGATRTLYDQVLQSKKHRLRFLALSEGLYGSPPMAWTYSSAIICMTAGVGFTAGLSFVDSFAASIINPHHCHQRFIFLLTARNDEMIQHVSNLISSRYGACISAGVIELVTHCTASSTQRLDVNEFLTRKVEAIGDSPNKTKTVDVISCGPGGFMDGCRQAVVGLQEMRKRGIAVEYHPESFAW
ncbi:ferric reductase like transmembrane component-domain-containing protein [Myxozyma melibiosi]|uniref:Ferric reductase like transmembrane component-domain-containing protein n=1 Tax=Myxozyma melibiosi TaxID=54550 RepID=A0ABR1FB41_9ASCO